jgi:hypothetical protein
MSHKINSSDAFNCDKLKQILNENISNPEGDDIPFGIEICPPTFSYILTLIETNMDLFSLSLEEAFKLNQSKLNPECIQTGHTDMRRNLQSLLSESKSKEHVDDHTTYDIENLSWLEDSDGESDVMKSLLSSTASLNFLLTLLKNNLNILDARSKSLLGKKSY